MSKSKHIKMTLTRREELKAELKSQEKTLNDLILYRLKAHQEVIKNVIRKSRSSDYSYSTHKDLWWATRSGVLKVVDCDKFNITVSVMSPYARGEKPKESDLFIIPAAFIQASNWEVAKYARTLVREELNNTRLREKKSEEDALKKVEDEIKFLEARRDSVKKDLIRHSRRGDLK